MTLGEFVKEKRLDAGLSLRKFCEKLDIDPSNWSKIERSIIGLTLSASKLNQMVVVLNLDEKEKTRFYDLVTLAKREIPEYVYSDSEVLEALPIFFRTASSTKHSD